MHLALYVGMYSFARIQPGCMLRYVLRFDSFQCKLLSVRNLRCYTSECIACVGDQEPGADLEPRHMLSGGRDGVRRFAQAAMVTAVAAHRAARMTAAPAMVSLCLQLKEL